MADPKTEQKPIAKAAPVKDKCGASIQSCECKDEFCDKNYGKGLRVHTKKVKVGKCNGFVCCTCGKSKLK